MYIYSGAGNTFVIIDGRGCDVARYRRGDIVRRLCAGNSTDGLIILTESRNADFSMEFFNPDGSTGMMCGNGGRCITALAARLGIVPASGKEYIFEAPDGRHRAEILSQNGTVATVRLRMREPSRVKGISGGWFVDTGARHFVTFVGNVETEDVAVRGNHLRWLPAFAPEGTNVDFVQTLPDGSIRIRTFEKGVERETHACGTGAVASVIVSSHIHGDAQGEIRMTVHTRMADLIVERSSDGTFLTGEAELIGQIAEYD